MEFNWSNLSIESAQDFKQVLQGYVAQEASKVEIDLSDVNKIDLTAVQLLLSLQKTLEEQQRELAVVGCSESVKKAFSICGCQDALGCIDE